MSRSAWTLSVALLASGWLMACGPGRPPNILLIVVDTLRADRLGVYGNERRLTPEIDRLAGRGTVFQRAYSQSSWTDPSIASLLTSRYQSQHGVLRKTSILHSDEVTLAEVLEERGYATGAFSANASIRPWRGFNQGFQRFELLPRVKPKAHQRADRVNAQALDWLDSVPDGTPALLYVHYMEPHVPYGPPREILDLLTGGEISLNIEQINQHAMLSSLFPSDEAMLRAIRDVYDAEVMAVDREIGALLRDLERRGFLDNALVLVTADHGEEFHDHDDLGHGKTLFEEVIHVPLILVRPGRSIGGEVTAVVSLIDVAPTVLDLAGFAIPSDFEGCSLAFLLPPGSRAAAAARWLAALIRLRPRWDGRALSELIAAPLRGQSLPRHSYAVVARETKLIVPRELNEMEFYDLRLDSGERNPKALAEVEREGLDEAFSHLLSRASRRPAARGERALSEEDVERLRSLGYIE